MITDNIIAGIIDREKGWVDPPRPDHPTKFGMSLPVWVRYCEATKQTWRGTKSHLREATHDTDAFLFYRWYFADVGIEDMDIPPPLLIHVADLLTTHSKDPGVKTIIAETCEILGAADLDHAIQLHPEKLVHAMLSFCRIRYMSEVAEREPGLRRNVRGWVIRALKMAGRWLTPRRPTVEV